MLSHLTLVLRNYCILDCWFLKFEVSLWKNPVNLLLQSFNEIFFDNVGSISCLDARNVINQVCGADDLLLGLKFILNLLPLFDNVSILRVLPFTQVVQILISDILYKHFLHFLFKNRCSLLVRVLDQNQFLINLPQNGINIDLGQIK